MPRLRKCDRILIQKFPRYNLPMEIIQVGKTKGAELESLERHYQKLVSGFAKVEVRTVSEVKPSQTFGVERCKEEEGAAILKALSSDSFVIVLSEEGRQFSSVEFAVKLGGLLDQGRKVVFVIGGAFGLSEAVKARADLLLSLSPMTFTHQMVRVILWEQVYRAFCIIKGKEYHH